MTLHLVKMIGTIAGVACVHFLFVLVDAPALMKSRWLFGGLAVALSGLGIIGSALCLAVPRASGAQRLILASLLADVVQIAISLLDSLGALSGLPILAVAVGQIALGFASWILFMLFLRALAVHLQENYLFRETEAVLKFGVCLCLGGALLSVLLLQFLGFYLLLALLVAGGFFISRYTQLLLDARRLIP